MLTAIDWTLRNSKGLSLEKSLRTKEFGRLLEKQKNLSVQFPANSDRGIALRAGHLLMGRLLNTLPESEAIAQAKKTVGLDNYNTEERAMVYLCGRHIIKAASKCLPPEAIEMAEQWKNASADEQLEIVRKLYFTLRSNNQEPKGELTTESAWQKMADRVLLSRLTDARGYLPGLYGKWHKDTCHANCQGKTQMIVAFARLAGATALVVHPVQHAGYVTKTGRRSIRDMVVSDLRARGLENASDVFADGLSASYIEEVSDREDYFHVGAALRLSDGRWVFLDPNGLCWGVLSSAWGLQTTLAKLTKYKEVLPGLTLMSHDSEWSAQKLVDRKISEASDLIARSRAMEQRIHLKVANVIDLVDCLCESEDFDLLMRIHAEENGVKPHDLTNPEIRRYAVMIMTVGDQEKMWDLPLMLNEEFLKKSINLWLTFYHANAVNLIGNNEPDAGEVVHPVCEFSLPEYSIAVSALNSARFDVPTDRSEANRFFVRHSFDQTTLFNAMLERNEVGIAAREALQVLPFRHTLCQHKI